MTCGCGQAPPADEAYEPAKCAAGCGQLWKEWCRGCNLVFCLVHAAPGPGHLCREGKPCLPIFPAAPARRAP